MFITVPSLHYFFLVYKLVRLFVVIQQLYIFGVSLKGRTNRKINVFAAEKKFWFYNRNLFHYKFF